MLWQQEIPTGEKNLYLQLNSKWNKELIFFLTSERKYKKISFPNIQIKENNEFEYINILKSELLKRLKAKWKQATDWEDMWHPFTQESIRIQNIWTIL